MQALVSESGMPLEGWWKEKKSFHLPAPFQPHFYQTLKIFTRSDLSPPTPGRVQPEG